MKTVEIKIKNVMGIEDLTIQPGCLTLIEGRNAVGKTSVLCALRDIFSGGHDPGLIRKGAEQAEIALILDDGVTVTKVIKPDKSTLTVRHPQMGKVSKPQEYIDRLVDSLSVDPVLFLTQKPKDRLAMLLEAMPLRVTADQIGFLPAGMAKALDLDKHALEVLGRAHKALYDERTGLNKAAKEKAATANEMTRSLPAECENGGWNDAFEMDKTELAKLNASTQKSIAAIKDEAAAQKTTIEAQLQKQIDELRLETDRAKQIVENRREKELAALQGEYMPKRDALNTRMTEAKTMLEQAARADEARKLVSRLQAEASDLEKQSNQISNALNKLQDLKGSILEKTPIKGVTIQDGEILVDGVPFDRVNEARRVQIALEVARIRAGELPLVLCDDIEHFDSLNMEKFRKAAAKAGLQIIAARVTDGDLRVGRGGMSDVA